MPKLGRRSEVTELDHIRVAALTTRDAPFGTNETPTYRPRIIGGNMVNVVERPPDASDLPRYEKLSLVSDKPNNIDPRALTDFNRRYNQPYKEAEKNTSDNGQRPMSPKYLASVDGYRPNEDPFARSSITGKPTYITKRPDSKDISNKYPTLAPIDGNRIKNQQMSTVFEPEAWTQKYYKENTPRLYTNGPSKGIVNGAYGAPKSPMAYERNYMPPSTSGSSSQPTDSDDQFKARLLGMIPRGVFLPDTRIVLHQKDEMRLLNILAQDLYYADPLKLRDIYLDLSNSVDKQLSGYCQYQELFHSLGRVNFKISPDLLQLVAAMFVSDHRNQRDVNYEKFLSFVGVALKQRDSVGPPAASKGGYLYNGKSSPGRQQKPPIYFSDGGEGKLLRMIEEQLMENEFEINFERLINSFQMEDRDMRGTLSADQIRAICMHHRIPIQDSLISGILQRCEDNNRDEQYNWWAFVRFLERVQPAKTGLPIPASKRPLEYAKQLPAPNANWPKAESHHSPRRAPSWRRSEPPSPRKEDIDPQREIISRMDQELKTLEKNYEEIKSKSSRQKEERPWFKDFMQFADALYKQDEQYEGSLPYNDVAEWTKLYNDAMDLQISDHLISSALSEATKGGKVDIHKYLTLLGKRY